MEGAGAFMPLNARLNLAALRPGFSAVSSPFPSFRFRQPSPPQLLLWDARHVWFQVENGSSVQHIHAANLERSLVAAQQFHNRQPNRIGPARRPCRENSVRPDVRRRLAQQLKPLRAVKCPNHKKMRETFDVRKPEREFGQDVEHTRSEERRAGK